MREASRWSRVERLDDSPCEKLEQHLDDCESCKAFLASLESTIRQLRTAPPDSLTKVCAAGIRRKLLSQFPYPLPDNDGT